jgi:hypothetical protein
VPIGFTGACVTGLPAENHLDGLLFSTVLRDCVELSSDLKIWIVVNAVPPNLRYDSAALTGAQATPGAMVVEEALLGRDIDLCP